jgi:flagellar FliJ protein
MKKFRFKLKALLRIKQAVEKEVRNELMRVQALCEAKRQEIEQTDRKTVEWSQYYNRIIRGNANVAELAIVDRHITSLGRYREQLSISLEVLNRKRDDVAAQYKEIQRDLKMVEHLESTRREEHRLEFMKEEDKIVDEMATLRFAREKALYE